MNPRIAVVALLSRMPGAFKSVFLARVGNRLLRGIPIDHPDFGSIRTNLGTGWSAPFRFPAGYAFSTHWLSPAFGYRDDSTALRIFDALAPHYQGFLDVGAHLGMYSLVLARRHPQLLVHAFEPSPVLFAALVNNANSTAALADKIRVHQYAVADREGQMQFSIPPGNGLTSSLISTDPAAQTIEVKVGTLDGFMAVQGLDPARWLLKVDVENAEPLVIAGAPNTLARIPALIMEFLGPARQARLVEKMIADFGFRAYYLARDLVREMPRDDGDDVPGEYNWLLTRIDRQVLHPLLERAGLRLVTQPLSSLVRA